MVKDSVHVNFCLLESYVPMHVSVRGATTQSDKEFKDLAKGNVSHIPMQNVSPSSFALQIVHMPMDHRETMVFVHCVNANFMEFDYNITFV